MNSSEDKCPLFPKKRRFRSRRNPKRRKFRKKKQRKNQTDMLNAMENRTISYGECFWNNYRKVIEWQNSYMESYWQQQAQRLQQENIFLKQRLSHSSTFTSHQEDADCYELEGSNYADSEGVVSEAQSEYEVSEEFMNFIQASLKHKASLNEKQKNKTKRKNEKGDVREEQVINVRHRVSSDEDPMCEAPEQDYEKKRNDEMKMLYGRDSAKIHGMETAMHLGFMRKCDKTKPVMWPVVPLSHSFSYAIN